MVLHGMGYRETNRASAIAAARCIDEKFGADLIGDWYEATEIKGFYRKGSAPTCSLPVIPWVPTGAYEQAVESLEETGELPQAQDDSGQGEGSYMAARMTQKDIIRELVDRATRAAAHDATAANSNITFTPSSGSAGATVKLALYVSEHGEVVASPMIGTTSQRGIKLSKRALFFAGAFRKSPAVLSIKSVTVDWEDLFVRSRTVARGTTARQRTRKAMRTKNTSREGHSEPGGTWRREYSQAWRILSQADQRRYNTGARQ